MSVLLYHTIPLDMLPGSTKTLDVSERALYSDDGQDYLHHEVIIETTAIVHPQIVHRPGNAPLANQLPLPNGAVGVDGNPPNGNARVGDSLTYIEAMLKVPRKELRFSIGADRVIQAPLRLNANRQLDPKGTLLPCDPGGGPFPELVKILKVQGDSSAILLFRIRCFVNTCLNIVLSNRWEVTHKIDELQYTTRYVRGVAQLRKDLALFANPPVKIDDFRRAFFVPCPLNYKREDVDVTASSDGLTLTYSFADREQPLNSEGDFPGIKIEGNVTSGYQTGLNAYIEGAVRSLPGQVLRGVANPLAGFGLMPMLEAGAGFLGASIPIPKQNLLVRIWGNRNGNRYTLANLALQVAIDRMTSPNAPLNRNQAVNIFGLGPLNVNFARFMALLSAVSCYLTTDILERFVELRMEFLPRVLNLPVVPINEQARQAALQRVQAELLALGGKLGLAQATLNALVAAGAPADAIAVAQQAVNALNNLIVQANRQIIAIGAQANNGINSLTPAGIVADGGLMNMSRDIDLGPNPQGTFGFPANQNAVMSANDGFNPGLPNDGNTRGTSIAALLTQVFQDWNNCGLPTLAPAVVAGDARTSLNLAAGVASTIPLTPLSP